MFLLRFLFVLLSEYPQTDRARCDKRRDVVLCEELLVELHHIAGRIDLTCEHHRTATAYATLLVGPPHLLACRLEYAAHSIECVWSEQRHTTCKITNTPLAVRTILASQVVVSSLVGDIAHRGARVETQGVEIDSHRAYLLASATHQAVVSNLLLQHIVTSVTQEIDRLHIVDAELLLQLASSLGQNYCLSRGS